jgi:hypothetical protein
MNQRQIGECLKESPLNRISYISLWVYHFEYIKRENFFEKREENRGPFPVLPIVARLTNPVIGLFFAALFLFNESFFNH